MAPFEAKWNVDAKRLTEQARKARRLAASMVDQKATDSLLGLAAEYEAKLAELAAAQEAEQPPEPGISPPLPAATSSPLSQPAPPMEPEKD
jgi:hypothetical protein